MSCQVPNCPNPVQTQDKFGRLVCAVHAKGEIEKQAEPQPNKAKQPAANKKKAPAKDK